MDDEVGVDWVEWENKTSWVDEGEGVDGGNATVWGGRRVVEMVGMWVTPGLVWVGVGGNLLCVWVWCASPLRTLSSSVYLVWLAGSDTVFLASVAGAWGGALGRPGWCPALTYATHASAGLSVWLVVAFTVERYVAVCRPLLRAAVCTVRRARAATATLAATALLLYSYLLVAAAPRHASPRPVCGVRPQYMGVAKAMDQVDLALTLVLPVLTVATLNLRIARCVWHVDRMRHALAPPPTRTSMGSAGGSGSGAGRGGTQAKVTKMLLVTSSVFILLNLPSYLVRAYIFFWVSCSTSSLLHTSSSLCFILLLINTCHHL